MINVKASQHFLTSGQFTLTSGMLPLTCELVYFTCECTDLTSEATNPTCDADNPTIGIGALTSGGLPPTSGIVILTSGFYPPSFYYSGITTIKHNIAYLKQSTMSDRHIFPSKGVLTINGCIKIL